jgi:hypothetical protein
MPAKINILLILASVTLHSSCFVTNINLPPNPLFLCPFTNTERKEENKLKYAVKKFVSEL